MCLTTHASTIRYSLTYCESNRSMDKEPCDNIMGTFDVTILAIEEGVFEVKATGGDAHLG